MAQPDCGRRARTIVVALDESERSFHALEWALNTLILRNEITEDKIVFIHAKLQATSSVAFGGGGYKLSSEVVASMDNAQDRAIAQFMNRAVEICKEKQITAETKVERGDARTVICDAVEKVNAEFLVIGSHGYGQIKRAVLGSVSDYCAHHAKCPVVIVRQPHKKSGGAEDGHH